MALGTRKLQSAVVAGILFFVFSSPTTYRLVDSLLGGVVGAVLPSARDLFQVASSGCPSTYGIVLHSVAFALLSYGLMVYA